MNTPSATPAAAPTPPSRPGPADHADLEARAAAVLAANWRTASTVPSAHLYPFQWLWDSGFIALGWSWLDMDRARLEIKTLLKAQWANGFLPHIIYHDDSAAKSYFPGSDFQGTDGLPGAPGYVSTSGITQPPVLGFVLEALHGREVDPTAHRAFYELAVRQVFRFHEYLYRDRDPQGEGLVYIRHNWESGTDNSAVWDAIWATYEVPEYNVQRRDTSHVDQAMRPTKKDYNHYLHLINLSKQVDYDEAKMQKILPFLVQDPLFNAILIAANDSLARLAELLGLSAEAAQARAWSAHTAAALNAKLWDEELGLYGYYDLRGERFLPSASAPGIAPLFAGAAVPPARAARLRDTLLSPAFTGPAGTGYLCPSLAYTDPAFDRRRYWRGPVWLNVNWLIYRGLLKHNFPEAAARVRADSVELVRQHGFYEYFDPVREVGAGEGGFGGEQFSWTAALLLDMLREKEVVGNRS